MSVQSYYTGTSHHTPHVTGRKAEPPLEELMRRQQWVVWRHERRPGDAPDMKPTKVPYSPAGMRASSTDATTWGTFQECHAVVAGGRASGVGFVFSAGDPYFGIDLDGCRNPDTGEIKPWALEIIRRFNTYTEPSPSGTGVHIAGRGVKPAPNSRKGKHIECYDRGRFFTMTLAPIPGFDTLRDCGDTLTSWHRETWPPAVAASGSAPVALTMEDQDIIDRLEREEGGAGKARALLAGDHGAYPSASEGRMALAMKCCFYTDSVDQIARIVQASGMFKAGTSEQEQERRARQDATAAVEAYTGPRYDPERWNQPSGRLIACQRRATTVARQDATGERPETVEELRARLQAAEAERDQYRDAFNATLSIVKIEELDPSTRLTALGVMLLGLEFQAKGRTQTTHGHHMPASWIGKYSGQKPQTVNRQLKRLEEAELIDRVVRDERVDQEVESINVETGEIENDTYTRNGKRNYIALPENVIDIVPRLTSYQKPEDAPKRGGVRVPKCEQHPDAGIVKRTAYYCEVCQHEADHGRAPSPQPLMISDPPVRAHRIDAEAELAAEQESHASLIGDSSPVVNGPIKLEPDPDPTPRNAAFSWTNYEAPAPKEKKPDDQCIEAGCANQIAPGAKYYCAEHGGVASTAPRQSAGEIEPPPELHTNPAAIDPWLQGELAGGPVPVTEILARSAAAKIDPDMLAWVREHEGFHVVSIDGVECWEAPPEKRQRRRGKAVA